MTSSRSTPFTRWSAGLAGRWLPIVLAVSLVAAARAQPAPTAPPDVVSAPSLPRLGGPAPKPGLPTSTALLACVILPQRTADVGTPLAGIVDAVLVERGDTVVKGQVLVRMRADVERASTQIASTRAESQAEHRGALAAEELARQKLERSRTLQSQNFLSAQAVEQAESEYRVARERVAQAQDQRSISKREADGAAVQLSQRVLRAPFDGVVIERHANPGERYEDRPLLRVADLARLKVEVVAPTAYFGRVRVGQDISVQPELPGMPARTARVVQIDRVLDPASNTFRMRLDIDNATDPLPAGLRCKADLGTGAATRPGGRADGA